MSAAVKKIVLRTPAAVGSTDQFSALERCRAHAATSQGAAQSASASSATAQVSSSVAVAARDAALAAVGAVKATQDDASASVLDDCLLVAAPLAKVVDNPGGDETITLSVAAMSGATASGAGLPGVVPAPQAGDQVRYLRGDGLWRSPVREELGMANVEDAWTALAGPVSVLSGSQAAVPGDQTGELAVRRAIRPDVPVGASGHVASVVYEAGPDRTLLTVEGFVLDETCQLLSVGQALANAPLQDDPAGADLYLASIFNCLIY